MFYSLMYYGLSFLILYYSVSRKTLSKVAENILDDPTYITGFLAQWFLCTVSISDALILALESRHEGVQLFHMGST